MVVELSPHRVSPSPRRRRRLARCCPRGGGDVGELVPAAEAPIDGRSCRIRGVWTLEIAVVAGALLLCADKIKDVIHNVDKGGDLCELNPQLVQLEVCKSKLFHCSAPGGQGLQVAEVVPGLVLHQADMVGMFQ
uniref:Uncharacterized protein n=1 Tax=Oryza nivara TaxID=4536 RepID=A0A0E0IUA9_ORYNI